MENDELIDSSSASDSSSNSNDSVQGEGDGDIRFVDFNPEIPVEHNYLGENLEEVRGRTWLDEGSIHVMPILPQPGVVLVPGQTLPLVIFFEPTINMLNSLVGTNSPFGVVCVRYFEGSHPSLATIGTTAEIFEYRNQENQQGFLVKAKGRQRFRILNTERDTQGKMTATVEILPDVVLPEPLFESRLLCLDRHRQGPVELQNPNMIVSNHRIQRHHQIARTDALCSVWPSWVHANYNSHTLIRRIKSELSYLKIGSTETSTRLPSDQVELSFWVAQTMAFQDDQKINLLKFNSPIQRLRYSLSALVRGQTLCCRDCNMQVAVPKDIFSMSVEGPYGTFVNPGGFVHEILTLHHAKGLKCPPEAPSTEYSWFPGYAWVVASCRQCSKHMGWKFTATNRALKPKKFWCVCKRSLMIKLVALTEEDNMQLVV